MPKAKNIRWIKKLRFEEHLESQFRIYSFYHSVVIIRFGVLLAIILYSAFGFLDQYMLPATYKVAWLIRFAFVVPFLGTVLLISFIRSAKRIFYLLIFCTSLVLGLGILLMMYFSTAEEAGYQYYYSGLLLVILWIGTFSQLQFRHVLYSILLIIIGFFIETDLGQNMVRGGFDNPQFPVFVNNSFFLAGSAILAIVASYSLESSQRKRFLQKKEIEEEKRKSQKLLAKIETLFGQQVSEEVAKELVNAEGRVESQLYQVTVMFLDIRDFAAFADSRRPREVASFQNIVFSELIEIVRAHEGFINQMLGDGIMATFGAPVVSEKHAMDAVSAGFRILAKIEELVNTKVIPPIRIGIGLHSGQVLAGNIGNDFRKQYSLTGTTVNIAARIEQLNKRFKSQFLVSAQVAEQIEGLGHSGTSLGKIELKGITERIEIFQLV